MNEGEVKVTLLLHIIGGNQMKRIVIFERYFSADEKQGNYSKEFSFMQVIQEGNKIITVYASRWNSSYDVETIQDI